MKFGTMRGIGAYQILRDFGEILVHFYPLFPITNFRQRIFHTRIFGRCLNMAPLGVWPIDTYIPNFLPFGPGVPRYHVAMHQSFTDALVPCFLDFCYHALDKPTKSSLYKHKYR